MKEIKISANQIEKELKSNPYNENGRKRSYYQTSLYLLRTKWSDNQWKIIKREDDNNNWIFTIQKKISSF